MFTGVNFEKAIDYYRKGKKVLVLDRNSKSVSGTGYDTFDFRELFEKLDFLVDVPATVDPEFEQAVKDMASCNFQESSEEEVPPCEKPEIKRMSQAETKGDVIMKLKEQGMTVKEIVDKTGYKKSTVSWYCSRKTQEKESKKKQAGRNAERKLCKTCQYRSENPAKNSCDYILITGHSRRCSIEECNVYVRGKRLKVSHKTNE